MIGKGSYGTVSKGICLATGRIIAVKILINQCKTEYNTLKILREI